MIVKDFAAAAELADRLRTDPKYRMPAEELKEQQKKSLEFFKSIGLRVEEYPERRG